MSPTIFLVPGLWEGPDAYGPLKTAMEQAGFTTFVTSLKSTGTRHPGSPTMREDIIGIKADLERAADAAGSEEVILFLHSAGGFLGSNAMEGLAASTRKDAGKAGGVIKIVFFCAGIAPEGADKFGGPFIVDQDDGGCVCIDSINSLFHDLPQDEAEKWQAKMMAQPILEPWKTSITYCGWRDVPSTYIICEADRLLPVAVQENLAAMAGSKVIRIAAGHMAHISATDEVAKILIEEASDF